MSAKSENTKNPANLVNVHLNGLDTGKVIVRLEYVTSQEHIERMRRGAATAESFEFLVRPEQARKIAEGLTRQADMIDASGKAGSDQPKQ